MGYNHSIQVPDTERILCLQVGAKTLLLRMPQWPVCHLAKPSSHPCLGIGVGGMLWLNYNYRCRHNCKLLKMPDTTLRVWKLGFWESIWSSQKIFIPWVHVIYVLFFRHILLVNISKSTSFTSKQAIHPVL